MKEDRHLSLGKDIGNMGQEDVTKSLHYCQCLAKSLFRSEDHGFMKDVQTVIDALQCRLKQLAALDCLEKAASDVSKKKTRKG